MKACRQSPDIMPPQEIPAARPPWDRRKTIASIQTQHPSVHASADSLNESYAAHSSPTPRTNPRRKISHFDLRVQKNTTRPNGLRVPWWNLSSRKGTHNRNMSNCTECAAELSGRHSCSHAQFIVSELFAASLLGAALRPRASGASKESLALTYRALPTESPILAPRCPNGFSPPSVVSLAVWCSISELSSAPKSTTIVDIHIQVIRPIAAPNDP